MFSAYLAFVSVAAIGRMSSLRTVSNAGRLTLRPPQQLRQLAILMAVRRAGLSTKLESVHNRNEPHSGAGCLGLISNSDKTCSGQEQDLSYPNHG